MNVHALWWALAGGTGPWPKKGKLEDLPPFIRNDQVQPGIALDRKTNTAGDGMLYRLEHLRFKDGSGFWGHFSGTLLSRLSPSPFSEGIAGAGRKGRLATFENELPPSEIWDDLLKGRHLKIKAQKGLFWLYLLTPAAMEPPTDSHGTDNACLPGRVRVNVQGSDIDIKLDQESKTSNLPGASMRCIAAVTGPPMILGGLDMAKGALRANHSYVPPGASWLVEIKAEDEKRLDYIIQSLNNTHCLGRPEESPFGFGHILVGMGPELKEL